MGGGGAGNSNKTKLWEQKSEHPAVLQYLKRTSFYSEHICARTRMRGGWGRTDTHHSKYNQQPLTAQR